MRHIQRDVTAAALALALGTLPLTGHAQSQSGNGWFVPGQQKPAGAPPAGQAPARMGPPPAAAEPSAQMPSGQMMCCSSGPAMSSDMALMPPDPAITDAPARWTASGSPLIR